jgi:5-methylcytosine-specific restriction enzyme subunit McrC
LPQLSFRQLFGLNLATRKATLVESTPHDLELTLTEARALAEAGRRLAVKRATSEADEEEAEESSIIRCTMNPSGTWRITVTDAVGLIAVGDLRLLIEPKISRPHLFHLLGSSELFPRLDDAQAAAGAGTDLWELVARWLVQALERVLRGDLIRDYLPLRETLEAARGTIDPLATAQSYYRGDLQFVCDFEDFGNNTPLNRVLRAAVLTVGASADLSVLLRRRARAVAARMDDVGELRPGDLRVSLDRRSENCRDALTLSRNVLANVQRELTHGDEVVWTFLIRTPELVEAGVRNELRQRLDPDLDVRKETLPLGGGTMTVAPDLIFGSIDAIGDVKYKLSGARWLRSDLYEVVAFATAARTSRACVVGFQHSGGPRPPAVRFGDTNVRFFSWNCDEELAPSEAADRLAKEIGSWLDLSAEDHAEATTAQESPPGRRLLTSSGAADS